MHLSGGAENCVHRAGADAFDAADAQGLVNVGDGNCRRVWHGRGTRRTAAQQLFQLSHRVRTAGRAEIYPGITRGNGLSIRTAAGIPALPALGLRQQRINAVDQPGLTDTTAIADRGRAQEPRRQRAHQQCADYQ